MKRRILSLDLEILAREDIALESAIEKDLGAIFQFLYACSSLSPWILEFAIL